MGQDNTRSVIADNKLFQNKTNTITKILIFAFIQKKFSDGVEYIILAADYAQLVSQILLVSRYLYNTNDVISASLLKAIYWLAKLLNFGFFFEKTMNLSRFYGIFYGIVTINIVLSFIFMYALTHNLKKTRQFTCIVDLWSWIGKILTPLLYFEVTSLHSRIILTVWHQDAIRPKPSGEAYAYACFLMIVIAYITSHVILIHTSTILPSKSLTASKSCIQDIIMINHKYLLEVCHLFLVPNSKMSFFIMSAVNLISSISALYFHFRHLPYYKPKCIRFKGILITISTMLSFIYFLRAATLVTNPENVGLDTSIVIWIILTPFVAKLTLTYLLHNYHQVFMLSRQQISNSNFTQKIAIIREIVQLKKTPDDETKMVDEIYLKYRALGRSIESIVCSQNDVNQRNILKKPHMNKIFISLLENLLLKYPKDSFLQLQAAYYYGKKLKNYGCALRMIGQIEQSSPSYRIKVATLILKNELQASRNKDNSETKEDINLMTYVTSILAVARLKGKIGIQTDLQIELYKEYSVNSPDLAKLLHLSEQLSIQRSDIEKKTSLVFDIIPNSYLEPYFILMPYHLILNHSIFKFQMWRKFYEISFRRNEENFQRKSLNKVNIYQPDNVFLIVSGQKETAGKICYCSNSTERALSWNSKLLNGKTISYLVSSAWQNSFVHLINQFLTSGDPSLLRSITRHFVVSKTGYIVQMDLCFDIHPFMHQGFFINTLMRPVRTSTDHIILYEDGKVESFTKEIGEKLGLVQFRSLSSKKEINIKSISPVLYEINTAFNIVAVLKCNEENIKKDKWRVVDGKEFSTQKAFEIYKRYSLNGEKIRLDFLETNEIARKKKNYKTLFYNCKVEFIQEGESPLKLCTLDIISSNYENIQSPEKPIVFPPKDMSSNEEFHEPELVPSHQEPSENFEVDDEGVDIKPTPRDFSSGIITSPHTPYIDSEMNNIMTSPQNDLPLISPLSSSRGLLSRQNSSLYPGIVEPTTPHKSAFAAYEQRRLKVPTFEESETSLGSQASQLNTEKSVHLAYQRLMEAKYYPRYLDACFAFSCILLTALLIFEVWTESVLNTGISNMIQGKEILKNSETRSFLLLEISDSIYNAQVGNTQQDKISSVKSAAPQIKKCLSELSVANRNVILATAVLSYEDRRLLFDPNVALTFESSYPAIQDHHILNGFQAIDEISETVFRALEVFENSYTSGLRSFEFVTNNSLNNVLVESEMSSTVFLRYLKGIEDEGKKSIIIALSSAIVLFAFVYLLLTLVILKQFVLTKGSLSSSIRLDADSVASILKQLNLFKEDLTREASYQKLFTPSSLSKYNYHALIKNHNIQSRSQVHEKRANSHGLMKNHLIHWGKVSITMMVLLILFSFNYTWLLNNSSVISTDLGQLHFSYSTKEEVYISFMSLRNLLLFNDTGQFRNDSSSSQFLESIRALNNIQNVLTAETLNEKDVEYNHILQDILFGNPCSNIPEISIACPTSLDNSTKMNLINLLNKLSYNEKSIYNTYIQSNKSLETLQSLTLKASGLVAENTAMIRLLQDVLSSIFEQKFTRNISRYKRINSYITATLSILTVVGFVYLWYAVFRRIRESDNVFKKLLQAFPAELVLSNFLLRKYLEKTSTKATDMGRLTR